MDTIDGYVDPATVYPMVALDFLDVRGKEFNIPVIVDTGYNGEALLSESRFDEMDLVPRGMMSGETATGEVVEVDIYRCRLRLFDEIREITVGVTGSDNSLLGTLLLADCELDVNFKESSVRIRRIG